MKLFFFRCPLYSDTEALHEAAVLNGAETAKAEIGVDPKELKIDPTSDIKQHYSRLKKRIVPHVQPAIFGFLNVGDVTLKLKHMNKPFLYYRKGNLWFIVYLLLLLFRIIIMTTISTTPTLFHDRLVDDVIAIIIIIIIILFLLNFKNFPSKIKGNM